MSSASDRRSLLIIVSVFSFVILGTYAITLIARGYRPEYHPGGLTLSATGLLSATSRPKGASVYINGSLISATDDTVNLTPGEYAVKIVKDGYFSWQKTIRIKKEVVYQSDAELFRTSPDLKPLTVTSAINPTMSPDFSRIIFSVASSSATAGNGLYIVELTSSPLYINKNTPRQIATNFPGIDWSKASFRFSPNGRQVIAGFKNNSQNYLLNLDAPIYSKDLSDITPKLPTILSDWSRQDEDLVQAKIDRLPKVIRELVATSSSQYISFSPSENKVLYLADKNGQIPPGIISPPPAQSTQTQSRDIKAGNYYVYDILDDTNFIIGSKDQISTPFWLQYTENLIMVEDKSVKEVDYDGTNKNTLYAGNIDPKNVFPWVDGSRIIVLTSPYVGSPENLYAITIR